MKEAWPPPPTQPPPGARLKDPLRDGQKALYCLLASPFAYFFAMPVYSAGQHLPAACLRDASQCLAGCMGYATAPLLFAALVLACWDQRGWQGLTVLIALPLLVCLMGLIELLRYAPTGPDG